MDYHTFQVYSTRRKTCVPNMNNKTCKPITRWQDLIRVRPLQRQNVIFALCIINNDKKKKNHLRSDISADIYSQRSAQDAYAPASPTCFTAVASTVNVLLPLILIYPRRSRLKSIRLLRLVCEQGETCCLSGREEAQQMLGRRRTSGDDAALPP